MSNLVLTGLGASPWSLRGATQTLEHVEAATQLRRTVNGSLIDISATQLRKYKSLITGSDQLPPAFDSKWPGMLVTVDCSTELSYLTGGSAGRPVVSGSSRVDGAYTFYRPQLTMRIVNFQSTHDEYAAKTAWTLELEEV